MNNENITGRYSAEQLRLHSAHWASSGHDATAAMLLQAAAAEDQLAAMEPAQPVEAVDAKGERFWFEAWARGQGFNVRPNSRALPHGGEYITADTSNAWEGWQGRAALAHPRPTGDRQHEAAIDDLDDAVDRGDEDAAARALSRLTPPPTVEQAGEVVSTDNFGLTTEQIERLRMKSLKPDAISGDGVAQAERVGELVAWFARLATGSANPKWTTAHAYELAYYVATHAESRKVDIGATRNAAYIEGATISDGDRRMLERIGAIPTKPRPSTTEDASAVAQPRPVGVPDGWKLVPVEPTAEILGAAAASVWPVASADDLKLAAKAAMIVLKTSMDAMPGVTLMEIAASIATMAPAYRAMIAAAPAPAPAKAGGP